MEVYLGSDLVQVILIRKKNKNIYFRCDDDFNLVVTANKWVSEREIEKLIIKNEKALTKMYNKVLQKKKKEEEFWYLGNKYQVIFDINEEDINFSDFVITCKSEDYLNKFIKSKTKEIFLDEVSKMRQIIKTPDFSLKIRKMKTRWGVCNYKTPTVTLNSELIKYSRELIRYVIVHEFCHFYHHDHSKNFWHLVSTYYPNYKEARKELRD